MNTTLPSPPVVPQRSLPDAHCPRCGYDQRGVMAMWDDAWPLNGTCAECGLEFEWSELLNPNRGLPSWCVEAKRPARAFPLQVFGTMPRVWLAPMLWLRVSMTHPMRWSRLRAWMLAWAVLFVVTMLLTNGIVAIGYWNSGRTALSGGGFRPSTGPWTVFLHATLLPFSSQPAGQFAIATPTRPPAAPPPRFGPLPVTRPIAYAPPSAHFESLVRQVSIPLALLLAFPVCCGLAFAALPVSRRRAKVRAAHLVRATLYCFGLAFPLVIAIVVGRGLASWQSGVNASLDVVMMVLTGVVWLALVVMFALGIPALVVFWWSCARHHLRMTEPWAVAMSVTVLGLLTPIAIAGGVWVAFDPRWWL